MYTLKDAANTVKNGPEQKRVQLLGHSWNVKKGDIQRNGNRIVITGQLSHDVKFSPDDQVYYTIRKENGVLKDTQVRIGSGGWAGLAAPFASVLAQYFGVPLTPDKINEVTQNLMNIAHHDWRSASQLIVANFAAEIN